MAPALLPVSAVPVGAVSLFCTVLAGLPYRTDSVMSMSLSDQDCSPYDVATLLARSDFVCPRFRNMIRDWAADFLYRELAVGKWKEERRLYFLEDVLNDKQLRQPPMGEPGPREDGLYWNRWTSEPVNARDDSKNDDSKAVLTALENKNTPIEAFVDVSWDLLAKYWDRFECLWKKKQQEELECIEKAIQGFAKELKLLEAELRKAKKQGADEDALGARKDDIVQREWEKEKLASKLADVEKCESPKIWFEKKPPSFEPDMQVSIDGWVPESLLERSMPVADYPLPPREAYSLSMEECYALLGAYHDSEEQLGQVRAFATDDFGRDVGAYSELTHRIKSISVYKPFKLLVTTAFDRVEKDLRNAPADNDKGITADSGSSGVETDPPNDGSIIWQRFMFERQYKRGRRAYNPGKDMPAMIASYKAQSENDKQANVRAFQYARRKFSDFC